MSAPFPIMFGYRAEEELNKVRRAGQHVVVVSLPWAMIAPHEAQARQNHSQSLVELASRGGLDACEAVAVLENRRWREMDAAAAQSRLGELLTQHLATKEDGA